MPNLVDVDLQVFNMLCTQEAVLRPLGPFIMTMEATQRVTISLVLPMVSLCLKAIHPNTPLLMKDSHDGKLRKQVIEVNTLFYWKCHSGHYCHMPLCTEQ